MLHKTFLFALVFMLVLLPVASISQAASDPAVTGNPPALRLFDKRRAAPGSAQAFAPGQVLIRFESDISQRTAASLVAPHGATLMNRIAAHTFILAVPAGHEEQMVKALASNPAIQYASLNYRMMETPAGPLKPVSDESALQAGAALDQEQPSCITDLWMSATRQGEPLQDNMLPSDTPQVYVFFEFADCDREAVRVQVFHPSLDTKPEEIFTEEGLTVSGSGALSVEVRAWDHFTEKGTFPIGRYLTIVSVSPEGGWDPVKTASWHVSTFPDDHWFRGAINYQWSLHSTGRLALPEADINAPQAWDITTGSPDLILANVSSGVWIDHPDLKNKIWTNRDEIPGNGVDDDENGCVDDVHGCEFYNGESNGDFTDERGGSGTVTSGITAAETNNEIGMAGVSWGARIMPIKVVRRDPEGRLIGYLADVIKAIDYAVTNEARVIHIGPRVENVSEEQLELLRSAIDDAVGQGALVVAGAGHLADTSDDDENHVVYPAGFENVVAVGASDLRNERAWFSNFWPGIDLVAPGELILSTYFSEQWQYFRTSGTNLSAAHVEGVALLIWSINPNLSPNEVRTILQESAVDLGPAGYDEEYGHGKLEAAKALAQTPHHLWLRTANLDRLELIFLLDDSTNRPCQSVWNYGTGRQTWTLKSDSGWLTVEDPGDPTSAPVPSDKQVCADTESLGAYGTFETTLEANSTLTRHEGPVVVDVTATYQPNLPRIRLSFVQR